MEDIQFYDWNTEQFEHISENSGKNITYSRIVLQVNNKIYYNRKIEKKVLEKIAPQATFIRFDHLDSIYGKHVVYVKKTRRDARTYRDFIEHLGYVLQCPYRDKIFRTPHYLIKNIHKFTNAPISFLAYNPVFFKIFSEDKIHWLPKINHEILCIFLADSCVIKREPLFYLEVKIEKPKHRGTVIVRDKCWESNCYFQWLDPNVPFQPLEINLPEFCDVLTRLASQTSYQILTTIYQSITEEIRSRHDKLKILLEDTKNGKISNSPNGNFQQFI